MKKLWNRAALLLLALCLLLPQMAEAAVNDKYGRTPLIAYGLKAGRITTYVKNSFNQTAGWIDGQADQIKMWNTYADLWFYCEYPTKNGGKLAWFRGDAVFADPNFDCYEAGVTGGIPAYRKSDFAQTIGSISANDRILVVAHSGDKAQVIYPISGGYKLGWIKQNQIRGGRTIVTPAPNPLINTTPARESLYTPPNGWYVIASYANQGLVVDVDSSNTHNGANVLIWHDARTKNQIFYLQNRGSGWYTIRPQHVDKVLDVAGGSSADGTNVQLYQYNGTNAQMWRFLSAGNNSYYIESKLKAGLSFDIAGANVNPSTNLQVYPRGDVPHHKWVLKSVNAAPDPAPQPVVTKPAELSAENTIANISKSQGESYIQYKIDGSTTSSPCYVGEIYSNSSRSSRLNGAYIDPGDAVYVFEHRNGSYRVMYPTSGGSKWRLAWIKDDALSAPAPVPSGGSWAGRVGQKPADVGSSHYYSPNPFSRGQCTWYAWGRTREVTGISITFSKSSGRHARYWAQLVNNCRVDSNLTSQCVAVRTTGGGGYGHVVFVESVEDGNVYYTDANAGNDYKVKKTSVSSFKSSYKSFIHPR